MARGIGGDDGPTLWMFAACILIWYKLADLGQKAKNTISDEVNTNHGGIFQGETTAQISAMEKFVAGITYRSSKLSRTPAELAGIANTCWLELKATFNTNESKLFGLLNTLNADDLKCVAKKFGVKETSMLGLTTSSNTLFTAFDEVLSDGIFSKDLTEMHTIWKKTGLW